MSVALGLPLTDSKRSGPRDYWQAQFKREERHGREEREESDEKKQEPRRLAGLGDEAFWVGDPVTGALYVLRGEVFLRVSVGGSPNQSQKIKRARTLAIYALKRLDTSVPLPAADSISSDCSSLKPRTSARTQKIAALVRSS